MITAISILFKKRWILLFIVLFNLSCASQPDVNALKIDAEAFCEAHNPANWNNFSGDTIEEANIELKKILTDAISSDQFNVVVNELESYGYNRQLYKIAQKKISPLIGRKWECDSFKQYYTTTLYSEKTGQALSAPEMIINLDQSGQVTVNTTLLTDTRAETLKQFIITQPQFSAHMKFTIRTNNDTPAKKLIQTFFSLGELDIQNINIEANDEQLEALREVLKNASN